MLIREYNVTMGMTKLVRDAACANKGWTVFLLCGSETLPLLGQEWRVSLLLPQPTPGVVWTITPSRGSWMLPEQGAAFL